MVPAALKRAIGLALVAALLSIPALPGEADAQLLAPTGFHFEQVLFGPWGGRTCSFDFLPDGRVIIVMVSTAEVIVAPADLSGWTKIFTVPDVDFESFTQGLTGIAVDPGWPARPYFYLYYTHPSQVCHLVMYTVSGDLTDPASTNLTLSDPYFILTDIPDASVEHQGGTPQFGPDGMLYCPVGDDRNDCSAQDLTILGGAMLRLDVSALPGVGPGPPPKSMITPVDNPFPGPNENEKLVYAWGLRNVFGYSFDDLTGDLYMTDVGLGTAEELNIVPASSGGGQNFGWPLFEGTSAGTDTCGQGNTLLAPDFEYGHEAGFQNAIIGGPVYYSVPSSPISLPDTYDGSYFYGEYGEGAIRRLVNSGGNWIPAPPVQGQPTPNNWAQGLNTITQVSTGPDGALYVMNIFFSGEGIDKGLFRVLYDGVTSAEPVAVSGPEVHVTASPNPTSASTGTTLRWQLPRPEYVTLTILNASGRVVRTLLDGAGSSTVGSIRWDGRSDDGTPVSSGMYFYRLQSRDGRTAGGKISLVR